MEIELTVIDLITFEVNTDMKTRRAEFEQYELVQNDTLPFLKFILKDKDENPYDLTGAAVKFFFRKYCSEEAVNLASPDCIIESTEGICRYEWNTGDLAEPGLYFGELEIEKGGKTLTIPHRLRFRVFKELET